MKLSPRTIVICQSPNLQTSTEARALNAVSVHLQPTKTNHCQEKRVRSVSQFSLLGHLSELSKISMASSSTTTSATDSVGGTPIIDIHPKIIQTHILTRLDGPTLASLSCVSSQLHDMCMEGNLWKALCNSNWPSTKDARVEKIILTFPFGHASFFSDSYPTIRRLSHRERRLPLCNHPESEITQQEPIQSELLSAVDIHYGNETIYSKVSVKVTGSSWFKSFPFRLDLLDTEGTAQTPLKFDFEERTCTARMEKNMRLSWILIDPVKKRAINMSSLRPVKVWQAKSTRPIVVNYTTVMAAAGVLGGFVKCVVYVTCEEKDGGILHLSEIGMQVEDIEGKILSGNESLRILQEAMEGKRVRRQIGQEKKMYETFQLWKEFNILNPMIEKLLHGTMET